MDYERFLKNAKARRKNIAKMRAKGMTLKQIGAAHSITRQRVWQILRAAQ